MGTMTNKGHRPTSGKFKFMGRGGVVFLVLLSLPALILFTISRRSGSGVQSEASQRGSKGKGASPGKQAQHSKIPHIPVVPANTGKEGGDLSGAAMSVADFVTGHPKSVYDFSVMAADGSMQSLEDFDGSVLLIVNVASNCGFTDVNYRELQELQEHFHGRAFSVLSFPCNQFGNQEPGTMQEIEEFALSKYKVTFPIMSKIEVNGPHTSPLFSYLKNSFYMKAIPWNFQKFLCNSHGQPVHQFASQVDPSTITPVIERLLSEAK